MSWVHCHCIMNSALCRCFPYQYENNALGLVCSWQQVMVKAPKKERLRSCSFIRWCSFIYLSLLSFCLWPFAVVDSFGSCLLEQNKTNKQKNLLALCFKSPILCKLKWSCLHQDIKILHSRRLSGTCWVRNQKALPLQRDVVFPNCVFSLLEKKQFWWITQSSFSGTESHTQTALEVWRWKRSSSLCALAGAVVEPS